MRVHAHTNMLETNNTHSFPYAVWLDTETPIYFSVKIAKQYPYTEPQKKNVRKSMACNPVT